MLDFQRRPAPRNYLSRREQGRLLLLVVMLGLVIFLARQAQNPASFAWLWTLGQGQAKPAAPASLAGGTSKPGPSDAYFPGVQPEYLKTVRDDSPFVGDEKDAWFNLLSILQKTDDAALAKASDGRVTYVQMLRQAEEYRGRLVTLRGTMRRANQVSAPKNDYGFQHYYQTWITPQDDPSNLVVVYCLTLPEGFPRGMKLEEGVELVGFFFKRWLYQGQDKLRTAPVVLARSVSWLKRPVAAEPAGQPAASVPTMVGVAALFAVLVTAYVYYRTRRGGRHQLSQSLDERLIERSEILPQAGQSLEQPAREDRTGGE